MAFVSMHNVNLRFDNTFLLENASLQIEKGEKICLIGRNGVGKTTLLRMLSGEVKHESGQVNFPPKESIAMLSQEVPQNITGTNFEVVVRGLGKWGDSFIEYYRIMKKITESEQSNESFMAQLAKEEEKIEKSGGWDIHKDIQKTFSHMNLDPNLDFQSQSAGMKRRVLLARALVASPELLLLDEPTNHLDIDAICYLEEFLTRYDKTLLFVTHDRSFLQKVATRILEIDRGVLTSFSCDYQTYLERKESMLLVEQKHQANFDKKLAGEEIWVRKGILARRTRNEGRVRALMKMREEKINRRKQVGIAKMKSHQAGLSGNLVIRAKDISFAYGENTIVKNFSSDIMRGDKIGIMGKNGIGKTTLLHLLLGKLKPLMGEIYLGTKLEIAYFDQLRQILDEDKTVIENVGEGNEKLNIGGKVRSIFSYLQDFLFTPERAKCAVWSLSGGERNRLLLAKLFTKPSNMLILDEPTNDLDTETMELLERLLVEYKGTLLLISHDRTFINNVVTSTFVFEGDGQITEYAGGYDDWLIQRPQPKEPQKKEKPKEISKQQRKRKLTYKETQELEAIPFEIEKLEEEKEALFEKMSSPDFYQQGKEKIQEDTKRHKDIAEKLDMLYLRWEELEYIGG